MRRPWIAIAAIVLVAGACGDDDAAAPASGESARTVEGNLNVFAATSLTDAFTEIGEGFEAAHPGVDITFNFAGSSALVTQIVEGAPADVFASADTTNMDKLVDASAVDGRPHDFATNTLAIVVPKDNPAGITSLADLADPDVKVALCDGQVPCGRYALEIFSKAGVAVSPASLEENVGGVLTKAELGEVDAGIVYITDVQANGDAVGSVAIPDEQNVVARYPIASLATAENAEAAAAFVDYVVSGEGRATLDGFGFGRPEAG